MADDDQPTLGLRVGDWLPPTPDGADGADGADATGEPTTDESGQARPRAHHVTRHAHIPQDLRALRALAGLLAVAVAVAVLVYLIASSTVGPRHVSAPPAAGPSGLGAFAPTAEPFHGPTYSGQFPPAPGQPATSASARRSAAPDTSRAPGAGGGAQPVVTLTQGAVPPLVDLTSVGSLDWVHFGLNGAGPPSTDHKRGGSGAIVDLGGTGGRGWYANNPQQFRWRDGQPTSWMNGTPTGVYVCGANGGFALAVDAGPGVHTLRLYAGVWRARGQLTVSLPSGAPAASAPLDNRNAISTAVFTIAVQSSAGTRLVLRWTTTASYDPRCGNVDMQAAALS